MTLGNADRLLKVLVLLTGLLVGGVASAAETPKPGSNNAGKKTALTALLANLNKIEETCDVKRFSCGLGARSILLTTDCALDDGTFVDFWLFDGTIGDTVIVDLKSGAFDSFLFLLDTTPEVVAVDDDSGEGTNSRISFELGVTGEWTIAANNFFPLSEDPGLYTVELSCNPIREGNR